MDTKCLHSMLCKLIVYCLVFPGGIDYALGKLLPTSDCNCVGYNVMFRCTTTGNGVTKWRGTALHCPHSRNEIGLKHERFENPHGTSKQCNGGEIIGQSLQVEGNNYTSQLIVPVKYKLDGTTVECVYEDLLTNEESVIGQIHLTLTTEPFWPPDDIHLADASQKYLLFSWSTVANNCASLQYEINSTCGVCPNITNAISVSCAIGNTVSHKPKVCSFAVRSIVCGNVTGRWSDSINVKLKVPEPPIFTSIQASYDANRLTGLDVEYKGSAKDTFYISRNIDGYIRNFTIVYSDNLTNHSCAPLTTSSLNSSLPQSCFPTLLPNNNITVSISASNRLGKGKERNIIIAATNEYVNLITSSKRITCRFVREQESSNIQCNASYGVCGNPKQWKTSLGNTTESPTVVVIDLYLHDMQEYCYKITATINDLTVIIIRGYHNYSGDGGHVQPVLIALTVVTVLLSTVVLTICIIIAFKIYQKYHPNGVHAVFELLDQPWQLLKVLQGLKELGISINETKFGECTSKGTRNIYMRFDNDPSEEQAKCMKHKLDELKLLNRKMMNGKVTNSVKSIPLNEFEAANDRQMDSVPNAIGSHSKFRYTYARCLPPRPGALYSLILGIRDLSSTNNSPYSEINCNFIGIEGTPKGEAGDTEICLTFDCEHQLPNNWREDFDNIIIKFC